MSLNISQFKMREIYRTNSLSFKRFFQENCRKSIRNPESVMSNDDSFTAQTPRSVCLRDIRPYSNS